jgi:hypothetical protein
LTSAASAGLEMSLPSSNLFLRRSAVCPIPSPLSTSSLIVVGSCCGVSGAALCTTFGSGIKAQVFEQISQGTINIPTAILSPMNDISGLSYDILTLNYLTVNQDLNITGNLFVNGYIYSTVQTCFIANLNNSLLQSNEINTITISSFYNNLYNIKSNNVETNLFYSNFATIGTLNNSNVALMSEVYSDDIYNTNTIVTNTIVCDNDIYSNNIRTLNFVSISNLIQFNDNITLPYPFQIPNNINMLGYQVIGTIITNGTAITSNTLYTLGTIFLPHGVWNIFGQVSFKCSSASALDCLTILPDSEILKLKIIHLNLLPLITLIVIK